MRGKSGNFGGKAPKTRLYVLFAILLIACGVFFGRLVNLQFASRDVYSQTTLYTNTQTLEVPTVRGQIADRNGVPLVSNKISYDITLDKNALPAGKVNSTLYELILFLGEKGISYPDLLPVSERSPYLLNSDFYDSAEKQRYVKNFANYVGQTQEKLLSSDASLYEYLYSRYGMRSLDIDEAEKRRLVGLRFSLDTNAYSTTSPFVIAGDAPDSLINSISDSLYLYPGLEVSVKTQRYYNIDSVASHILGRTDIIYAEDADYYREKGYNLTEIVGKSGAEFAFEEYLRGINGKKKLYLSDDGEEILGEEKVSEEKPGYTVRLTIDAEMQKVAEESLRDVIREQANAGYLSGQRHNGEDANAGAVVVIDPRDASLRVVASYPTYSQNTYSADAETLLKDTENAPLLNRATSGRYEPGSTFKIATALAALHFGFTTPERLIYDEGEFEDYPTYKPHCWVLDRHGYTHGWQNLLSAIQNSCNYYFFRVGKEMGIEKINEYAKLLGFGVKTGIEIGENAGVLYSPEYKEANGLSWNPGDTLQSAIGQQHLFTPLQLASFGATILSGGKRYEAHLFDSAVDYSTGEVIEKYEPKLLSELDIPSEYVELIKEAMRRVIDDGTASSTFIGYKYPVGGKTGTAQVPNGSDNVIFLGFAPYDNPEIVVSVILEHGNKSGNAARIAKNIFDCYFSRLYPDDFGVIELESENEETPVNVPGLETYN